MTMRRNSAASPAVLAVDIGGTTVKGALLGSGSAPRVLRVPTGAENGPDAALDTVLAVVDELVAQADLDSSVIEAAAVATLGVVDEDSGTVIASTIGWTALPLGPKLSERASCPVRVVNDVRAGALAEASAGAGRGIRTFCFAAAGTGLSVGLVAGGEVLTGARWSAGEIGQLPAAAGTVEQACSARGIERAYAAATVSREEELSATGILRLAAAGDPAAQAVRSVALGELAHALAWVISVFDPEVVVIGGGLSEAADDLLVPLGQELVEALPWRTPPPLLRAGFGAAAGLAGAALVAWGAAGLPADITAFEEAR